MNGGGLNDVPKPLQRMNAFVSLFYFRKSCGNYTWGMQRMSYLGFASLYFLSNPENNAQTAVYTTAKSFFVNGIPS